MDPQSGKFVLTSFYLASRGRCCGNGCRHCPWPADVQERAGRPGGAHSHPWTQGAKDTSSPTE
jgi:hypothetical protein